MPTGAAGSEPDERDRAQVRLAVLVGDHEPDLSGVTDVEVRIARQDALPEALSDADALLVWDFSAKGVAEALPTAQRLRWIHVSSAGVDRVLDDEVRRRDFVVTNVSGVLDETMAEYVLGLVLALVKDLRGTLERQFRADWEHRPTGRLAGRRALVVGVGAIGRATADLLRGVGVQVDGVGRTARDGDGPFGTVYGQSDLPDVVGAYDIVVLAAPLTAQTRRMFDASTIAAMRSSAYLINAGRGELVDEPALTDALRSCAIAGAALDVFATEPLPRDNPLWMLPNVIVSPHMAGDYVGWRDDLLEVFLENLDRYRTGRPLLNKVDKELGYIPSH
ncbi:D-2-hydroxyacid dehydrogenase [Nocardioidaceae bacterium SCSIO 66511]|nr:D-2-hydroxyacid dehydrogenase [Nocardioidaceae bacterium SCSIO 66511]